MRLFKTAVVMTLMLALAACSSHVDVKLGGETEVYIDQVVQTSQPAIYIQPANAPQKGLSVLVLPFTMKVDMDNPRLLGAEIMRSFWQEWTSMKVFPTQVFDETLLFRSPEQAVFRARERGADLVMGGDVTYYLNGGTRAGSAIALRVDIYDAKSGELVWSLAQSGRMDYEFVSDFILGRRRMRMPDDPMSAIISRIAGELGFHVRKWANTHGQWADLVSSQRILEELMQKAARPEPYIAPAEPLEPLEPEVPVENALPPMPSRVEGPKRVDEKDLVSESLEQPAESGQTVTVTEEVNGTETTHEENNPLKGIDLNITFETGSDRIAPEAANQLNELGKALSSDKLESMSFELRGHTDDVGGKDFNQKLSLRRANAVKRYLVENFGISPERIQARGFGESMPVVPNDTKDNKQRNRRVEVLAMPVQS